MTPHEHVWMAHGCEVVCIKCGVHHMSIPFNKTWQAEPGEYEEPGKRVRSDDFEVWEEKTVKEQGSVRDVLNERKNTHGDYTMDAEVAVATLKLWQRYPRWGELSAVEAHAIMMIAFKVARILTGDPHFADHWRDIAGYATLVEDRLD